MDVSKTKSRKVSIRIPSKVMAKVEAIAQKEGASSKHDSDSVKITSILLMLLELGLEGYQDKYGKID